MSTSNTVESPIINSPIISSPIVNSPISGSPISIDGASDAPDDFNPCCAAGMPAGNRMFYFKFVFYVFLVLGGGMYGFFKLCESMGWFG